MSSADTDIANRLLEVYRQYVGEPEQLRDVYLGFGLFFGGITFAAVGVLLFLWSATYPEGSSIFWQLRELAIVLAALGLPAFLLSLVVLLPVDRRSLYVAGVGSLICLGALALFVSAYPYQWNVSGQDASTTGIMTYAAGLVVLVAATGAALVANYIERTRPTPAEIDATADETTGASEDVSDEQVRQDIQEAMDSADISWGGVEKTDTKRLKLQTDDVEIDRSGFDNVSANETRAESSVDDAVSGLQKLRGNEQPAEDRGKAVDDQANALRELREQQAAEPEEEESVVDRLRDRLGF